MIIPKGRILIYQKAIDLRKSYLSLSALIEQELSSNSMSEDAYVFINRNKTLAKVLWWDRTGWCLFIKKLSSSKYRISDSGVLKELEIKGIRMFFDGL